MPAASAPVMPLRRMGALVACVVALHALALWGVQRSLQHEFQPAAKLLALNVELIVPPAAPPPAPLPVPVVTPVPLPLPISMPMPAPKPPAPPVHKKAKPPKPAPQPAPPPVPQAETQPAPQPAPEAPAPPAAEPALTAAAQPAAPSAPAAAAAANPPAATPAAAPFSSDVRPLDNPQPPYPMLSRRLGESGQVIVRVLVGADGRVREVRLQHSSGHDRLDDAALQAVRRWRWPPMVRNGVPQAMWLNQPVDFVLQ